MKTAASGNTDATSKSERRNHADPSKGCLASEEIKSQDNRTLPLMSLIRLIGKLWEAGTSQYVMQAQLDASVQEVQGVPRTM